MCTGRCVRVGGWVCTLVCAGVNVGVFLYAWLMHTSMQCTEVCTYFNAFCRHAHMPTQSYSKLVRGTLSCGDCS